MRLPFNATGNKQPTGLVTFSMFASAFFRSPPISPIINLFGFVVVLEELQSVNKVGAPDWVTANTISALAQTCIGGFDSS